MVKEESFVQRDWPREQKVLRDFCVKGRRNVLSVGSNLVPKLGLRKGKVTGGPVFGKGQLLLFEHLFGMKGRVVGEVAEVADQSDHVRLGGFGMKGHWRVNGARVPKKEGPFRMLGFDQRI